MREISSLSIPTPIRRMVFSPHEAVLFCCEGSNLRVVSCLPKLSSCQSFSTEFSRLTDVSCHPFDDQVALVGELNDIGEDAPIEFWNRKEGIRRKIQAQLGSRGQRIKYSPDGKWLIAVGNGEIYQVLSLPDEEVRYQFPGGEQNRAVDFHPDFRTVLAAKWSQGDTYLQFCELGPDLLQRMPSESETYSPWWEDWMDKWEALFITIPTDAISDAIFSPDGAYIAYAYNHVLLRNFPEKRPIHLWKDDNSGKWSNPVFSLDSKSLFAGSSSGAIYRWDVKTGEIQQRITGHAGQINCLALSRDGRYLASSAEDMALKLWDLKV